MTRGARARAAVDYHPAFAGNDPRPGDTQASGRCQVAHQRAPFVGTTLADSGRANSCAAPVLSEAGDGTRREKRGRTMSAVTNPQTKIMSAPLAAPRSVAVPRPSDSVFARALDLLSSVRFGVALLVLLAAACMVGM